MYTSELPEIIKRFLEVQIDRKKKSIDAIERYPYKSPSNKILDVEEAALFMRRYAKIFQCDHSMVTRPSGVLGAKTKVWCVRCPLIVEVDRDAWLNIPSEERDSFNNLP